MIANVPAAIVHTPAARPSAPSVKFTTFITATMPTSVSARPAVSLSPIGSMNGQRQVVHEHARRDRDRRRRELPGELDERMQAALAQVVDGARRT